MFKEKQYSRFLKDGYEIALSLPCFIDSLVFYPAFT